MRKPLIIAICLAASAAFAQSIGVSPSGGSSVTINAQTGATYTYLSTDNGKLVTRTFATAMTDTLPQATGSFGAGWNTTVQNLGAGVVTITPTTSTINGGATYSLVANQHVEISSDGTNYQVNGSPPINNSGQMFLSGGTAANPAISVDGATTGIYSANANTLSISAVGSEQLRFQAGGFFLAQQSMAFANGQFLYLRSDTSTAIGSPSSAVIQLGAGDAASPVAQTFKPQSVSAGTADTAGVNFTVKGSTSTGSGVSGDIIIQTGGTGAGSTAQNSYVTALTVKGATQDVIAAKSVGTPCVNIASLPTGVTGQRACVNNQVTACPVLSGTFTAGGAIVCSAFYNGTAWVHE